MDDADAAEVVALVIGMDPYRYGFRGDAGDEVAINDMIDIWTRAMPDVDGRLALRAVVAHYRSSSKRIAISDVIEGAAKADKQDRAACRAQEIEQRKAADQAALPPGGPTRDRTRDLATLLAPHRRWSLVGDLSMRRRQASWHPQLEQAYRRAVAAQREAETVDPPEVAQTPYVE